MSHNSTNLRKNVRSVRLNNMLHTKSNARKMDDGEKVSNFKTDKGRIELLNQQTNEKFKKLLETNSETSLHKLLNAVHPRGHRTFRTNDIYISIPFQLSISIRDYIKEQLKHPNNIKTLLNEELQSKSDILSQFREIIKEHNELKQLQKKDITKFHKQQDSTILPRLFAFQKLISALITKITTEITKIVGTEVNVQIKSKISVYVYLYMILVLLDEDVIEKDFINYHLLLYIQLFWNYTEKELLKQKLIKELSISPLMSNAKISKTTKKILAIRPTDSELKKNQTILEWLKEKVSFGQ